MVCLTVALPAALRAAGGDFACAWGEASAGAPPGDNPRPTRVRPPLRPLLPFEGDALWIAVSICIWREVSKEVEDGRRQPARRA
jgi:hypothetical protein